MLLNSKISKNIHDQQNTNFCWAFSIASMLRQSLECFISGPGHKKLPMVNVKNALKRLRRDDFHSQLRPEFEFFHII